MVRTTAGQINDPCARACGKKHICGELNESFTCDVHISGMGCSCSGCCLTSLSLLAPAAPAAPPPFLPPQPSLPTPLVPPLAPAGLAVASTAELRAALASSEASAVVHLLPAVYLLGGTPLSVSGIDLTLEGLGGEATIDAEGLSRAIDVSGGGRLVLRHIRVINGAAALGGGLLVQGAGSSLLMEFASVHDCVSTSSASLTEGGG